MKAVVFILLALSGSLASAQILNLHCGMADSVVSLHAEINNMTLSGPYTFQGFVPSRPPETGVASIQNDPSAKVLHILLQAEDGTDMGSLDLNTSRQDDNGNLKSPGSKIGLKLTCTLQ